MALQACNVSLPIRTCSVVGETYIKHVLMEIRARSAVRDVSLKTYDRAADDGT